MNVDEVKDFIVKLKFLYEHNEDIKKSINIDELTSCLCDLDNLIEIYGVKSVILGHIKAIIVTNLKGKGSQTYKEEEKEEDTFHMVFYGHPGVGKSKTAKILARIWKSLEVIKGTYTKEIDCSAVLNQANYVRDNYLELYKLYIKPEHKDCKGMWKKNEFLWNEIRKNFSDLGDLLVKKIQSSNKKDDYVIIAGREDFVAEYTGQTSIKATNFLNSCLGKCIIIEEAYVLYTGDNDTYGMEALTVLNKFMSDHPREIIVIFTGYEDKLKESIFKAQPGLNRRCQCFFNLKGYSYEGLAKIFIKQLSFNNFSVEDYNELLKFFENNYNYFPNFGGDTLKLAYRCKIVYSENEIEYMFKNLGIGTNSKIITVDIIKKAFNEYKNNNIIE
jgi:energy-coupling factor transporter ATP-binding protein EcfA2